MQKDLESGDLRQEEKIQIIAIYVDDIFVASRNL